ncbi:hypothetical protein RUM44_009730 [Polyplax serrata]|uniref:Uncharacterized protein n=1 Tax=Polyplax serrata TaxID=468196 RepID=A0ABR1ATI0_POLSC
MWKFVNNKFKELKTKIEDICHRTEDQILANRQWKGESRGVNEILEQFTESDERDDTAGDAEEARNETTTEQPEEQQEDVLTEMKRIGGRSRRLLTGKPGRPKKISNTASRENV